MSEGFLYQLLYQFAEDAAPDRDPPEEDETDRGAPQGTKGVEHVDNSDRRVGQYRD